MRGAVVIATAPASFPPESPAPSTVSPSLVVMTRQVLFVQGGGADVHDQWDNALVASLAGALGATYDVRYPRMPDEDDPRMQSWSAALEREIRALDAGAFLVGHSVGATILIHALADRPALADGVAGVYLVSAPFVGDGGWPSDDITPKPDLGARLPRNLAIFLYHGDEDAIAPVEHVGLYARAIPRARTRVLPGRDHQLNNDLSEVAADILRSV